MRTAAVLAIRPIRCYKSISERDEKNEKSMKAVLKAVLPCVLFFHMDHDLLVWSKLCHNVNPKALHLHFFEHYLKRTSQKDV